MSVKFNPSNELLHAQLGDVANEFFERLAAGEKPDIEQYAQQHPEFADLIREIFPALGLMGHSDMDADIPTILGDFRIIRQIGRGGMGIVYEAEQVSMGRTVALKVLPFASMIDPKPLERFRNEVRAVGTLDHPHIVSVYSIGEERGVHYYAMQLIRGQSLAAVIKQLQAMRSDNVTFSGSSISEIVAGSDDDAEKYSSSNETATDDFRAPDSKPTVTSNEETSATGFHETNKSSTDRNYYCNVARLGIQAAEALAHAHEHGIIHRDIKPGNLMLDAHGQLFVTDFGLARIEAAGVTMTGDWVGTPRYMSPEQALDKKVVIDHRIDIYSLGVTLYEMLTLRPAFGAKDRRALLQQIATEEPIRPRSIDSHIPRELETIVLKAISKNRDERYDTASDFASDLQCFLEDKPIKAKPPTLVQRGTKWLLRHKPLVAAAAVILVLASIGLSISNLLIAHERDVAVQQRERATENLEFARLAVESIYLLFPERRLAGEAQAVFGHNEESVEMSLLNFYERLAVVNSDKASDQCAAGEALLRIAVICDSVRNMDRWKSSAFEAIETFERLVAEFPNEPRFRFNLAQGYTLMSYYCGCVSEKSDSADMGRRAVAEYERLVTDYPAEPDYQTYLARSLNDLGDNYVGHNSERKAYFQQGLNIAEQLVREYPNDDIHLLSYCWNQKDVARHVARENPSIGLIMMLDVVENIEHLNDLAPSRPDYRYELLLGYDELSSILRDLELPDESFQYLDMAESISRELYKRHPNTAVFQEAASSVFRNKGRRLLEQRESEEAIYYFLESAAICERLVDLAPGLSKYKRRLADSLDDLKRAQESLHYSR